MSKKIHLFKGLSNGYYNNACGKKEDSGGFYSAIFKRFLNTSPEKRCKTCENSNFFKEQLEKQEKKRVASAEELGEVEVFNKQQLCPYDLGKKGSYIGSLNCRNCEYNFSWDANKIEVKCLYKSTKQIHKTQKSLNEAIEKESDNEPVEEPYTWVNEPHANKIKIDKNRLLIEDENDEIIWVRHPEYDTADVAFKTENKQQADHYKNGVETIEKIETILTILGDEITPREGYLIGNFIKYIDRLGLKDDKKKDAYKAADYINRLISSKWIHEK